MEYGTGEEETEVEVVDDTIGLEARPVAETDGELLLDIVGLLDQAAAPVGGTPQDGDLYWIEVEDGHEGHGREAETDAAAQRTQFEEVAIPLVIATSDELANQDVCAKKKRRR